MNLIKKIIVIIYGILFSLVILEIVIRLGGFISLSLQEYKNKVSISRNGTYKIMCLGESTTLRQYPGPLEEILNKRNMGLSFSVIDKGRGSTNTSAILSQVETYLDEYHPDMVVTMMGCNDGGVRYYQDIFDANTWIFRHCRLYRFSRIIYMHILKKIKQEGIYGLKSYCLSRSKPLEPEESFKKAVELNPRNDKAYAELGVLYQVQGKLFQAEDSFKKAIELNPKNDRAYVGLGWFYRDQDKSSQSEGAFRKAIELNPKNDRAYVGLGWFYRDQGQFPQAEDAFKKALELNPKNDSVYFELGKFYLDQGKFPQSEDAFKKTIELNPIDDKAYGAISVLYEEIGKPELAKEYSKKVNRLRLEYYVLVTVSNYRKLKEILDKRGIRLVCVQYPMRNVEPLKRIFEKNEGVIFVNNESVFKEALKKASYKDYFRDMFGGDFGHCTEKGNRLLAQNIADTILRDIFGK